MENIFYIFLLRVEKLRGVLDNVFIFLQKKINLKNIRKKKSWILIKLEKNLLKIVILISFFSEIYIFLSKLLNFFFFLLQIPIQTLFQFK